MKKISHIVVLLIVAVSILSCGSTISKVKQENEIVGYTLKNKMELMQQKITNDKKNKTVIATP